jgi:predicted amidophosphoribosyltransferase
MIKFSDDYMPDQRPDIISYCDNCGCISASHFLRCPECQHKPLIKKNIVYYIHDSKEIQYAIKTISRTELLNRFIPQEIVDKLNKENMIYIARFIDNMIKKYINWEKVKLYCKKLIEEKV